MSRIIVGALACGLFAAGIGVGYAARHTIEPASYQGRAKPDAAKALLDAALVQAGPKGSWERIGVARVWYLAGHKAEAEAIFAPLLGAKADDSDIWRIARVYREAGEWSKAKALFERYLASNPEDEKGLAEVGAYHLLEGDREAAERLFARSFAITDEVWATIAAGGAYLGVQPQE